MATKYFVYPWAETGDVAPISDAADDPTLSYQHGYTVNYEEPLSTPGALPIPRGQFNQMLLDVTSNLQYWQQNGIYPFITAAANGGSAYPYSQGALCAYSLGDANGVQIWYSLIAANTATPGSDYTKWRSLSSPGLPIGTIIDYAGTTIPANYLACAGQEVSQTTYAGLFAAIGTAFNTGIVGAGNFLLPNLQRRVTIGAGGTAGVAPGVVGTTVGSVGGEESHTQAPGEVGAHTHPVTIMGDHSVSGTGYASLQASDQGVAANAPQATGSNGNPTAMNVTQPSIVVTKCIKAF